MSQPMTFATFHLFSQPPWKTDAEVVHDEIEQMCLLEELGFDEAWLGEHNARIYGIVGSLQIVAAAVAARTKRIRIGSAVTRVPLHHPLHTAEDLALIDVMSNGRLDWGIGKGYDHLEFNSYGVDFEEREGRWEEGIDIVLTAWREGRIKHDGQYWTIPDTELFPKPVQRPHPPAYLMVSRSDSSVVYAAQRLFPMIMGQGPDWDDAKHKVQLYRRTALEAGHAPADVEAAVSKIAQMRQMHVAESQEKAEREYERGLMWYFDVRRNREMYGFGGEPQPYEYYLQHRSVMLGEPARVRDEIQAYREYTGVNNMITWFNCGGQPHEQVSNSMRLFADKVMPSFK